jgi:nucleotide-binding universal stress UspA family protein
MALAAGASKRQRQTARANPGARRIRGLDERTRSAHGTHTDRVRVLWATDDSDAARVAEGWLLRLRWLNRPLVDVLCVATPRWRGVGLSLQTYRTAVREAVADLRQAELLTAMRTANQTGQRLQASGMVVQVWARHGSPSDEILALVRNENPDLVVVSPHGRRVPLFPQPSVTERVLRGAQVPTLVTRAPATESGDLPQGIVLAVGDEGGAEQALCWLARAGWLRESRLTLVGLEPDAGAARAVSESALERLGAIAAPEAQSAGVDWQALRAGPAADRLLSALVGMAADLVVIPQPRPGLRYELAETIGASAPVSVLVLPAAAGRGGSHHSGR